MITYLQGALAVFLLTVGIGQMLSTYWGLRGLSLVGSSKWAGYSLANLLLLIGGVLLPPNWGVLIWTVPAGLVTTALLLLGGSYINPPPHPDQLFTEDNPAHASCEPVTIPDGEHPPIPGLLLRPHAPTGAAVCLVPGAGDTKLNFKWRLVQALLSEGLTVLTLDLPGHGDYRQRPMAYPDTLSVIPAALNFLKSQPGMTSIGLLGISLGGALAIRSLAEALDRTEGSESLVKALTIVATPTRLDSSKAMFYREAWRTYFGSPSLSLLREISARQIRQSWYTGGYRSRHSTAELIELLNPLAGIQQLRETSILLVYSRRDSVSPPTMAQAMQQTAPWSLLIEANRASHVMLIFSPEINREIAEWLRKELTS
jgi:pimeloyl-ACP methyl ester carboxylesterase